MPPADRAPAPRDYRLTARLVGGLDGVARVIATLRGRRYDIQTITVSVGEGPETVFECTVLLTPAEADLLDRRLRRLPAVVAVKAR